MENIVVLEEGLEITTKVSLLTMDRIWLITAKLNNGEIGGFELNMEVIKLLLIDKSKIARIDEIMNGEYTDESLKEIEKWCDKVNKILTKAGNAKKKHTK